MNARARATVAPVDPVEPASEPDEEIIVVAEEPSPRPRRSGARGQAADRQRKRQVQQTVRQTLTKAQEYAFIRSDLRRLLVTAGPLLLLMLGLLFVIDR
jgi:hypothetical protein